MLTIKKPSDYSKDERKIFSFLTLHGTQRVVGSSSFKEIDYSADYDLMEYVKLERGVECFELVLTLFREKFKKAYKNKNVWITDFKCGVLPGGKPIRWNRESIEKGFQIIEDVKINFVDCLQEQSVIKMDVISSIKGIFNEFSEIYFFTFGDLKTYNPELTTKHQIEISLQLDMKEYASQGNYIKALKRLFAYLRLSETNPDVLNLLVSFFNSKTGELYNYKSDLDVILLMLKQQFRPVSKNLIVSNLKHIGKGVKMTFPKTKFEPKIEEAKEILNKKIQEQTKGFIQSENKISQYINI